MNETTLFIIIGIILVPLFTVGYFLQRNRCKVNYIRDITYLHAYLSQATPSELNFMYLLDEFDNLARNNRDKERTLEIWNLFKEKYEDFIPVHAIQRAYKTFTTLDERLK